MAWIDQRKLGVQLFDTLPRRSVLQLRILRVPRIRLSEARIVWLLAATAYLGVAAYVVFGLGVITPDAWSRVGNAFYVLFSRDPHLAALGFVWSPLPPMLIMPLLLFKAWWPELVTHGFAASIVSALFMAGCVVQLHGILSDLGVRRVLRVALTLLFAVQPMILLYAANGMTEAILLFFLLVTARYLMRWLDARSPTALAVSGVSLALAYWTRYEAAAAALAVVALVVTWSYLRSSGTRKARRLVAVADGVVVGLPFVLAFVLFAIASWMIVGSPLEIFTSEYGNTAQVSLAREWLRESTGQGTDAALGYALGQIDGLVPSLLVLLGTAGAFALWRRDPRLLGITAVMGGVLVFAVLAFLAGLSFGWLRFYMTGIPLVVVLGGVALSTQRGGWVPGVVATWLRQRPSIGLLIGRGTQGAAAALIVLLLTAGTQASLGAMLDPTVGREEALAMRGWLWGLDQRTTEPAQMQHAAASVARYLDGQEYPEGSVLVDVATGFPVVLQSSRPTQFVMTPDRDFPAALNDPAALGVRYLLALANTPRDVVGRVHGLTSANAASADFVRAFEDGPFTWSLYAVRDPVVVDATE